MTLVPQMVTHLSIKITDQRIHMTYSLLLCYVPAQKSRHNTLLNTDILKLYSTSTQSLQEMSTHDIGLRLHRHGKKIHKLLDTDYILSDTRQATFNHVTQFFRLSRLHNYR